MFVFFLAGCGGEIDHVHDYRESKDSDYHWYECYCGKTQGKTLHDFKIAGDIIKETNCEEDGIQVFLCSCGESIEKTIYATGHKYNILEKDNDYHWYECSCGDILSKESHNYTFSENKINVPTCTEAGFKECFCECGQSTQIKYADAFGHSFSEWRVLKYPTLTETGLIERYCYNDSFHSEVKELPILNAVDYELNITTMPTCYDEGYGYYIYTLENTTLTFYTKLEKIDHTPEEKFIYSENSHYHYCSLCNNMILEEEHEFDSKYICTICNFADHVKYYNFWDSYYVSSIKNDVTELIIMDNYRGAPVERISSLGNSENCVSIFIPKTIKEISTSFENFSYLTNVYYYGTIEDWCSIKFSNSSSNPMSVAENFYLLDSNGKFVKQKNIKINNNISEIKNYAFYDFENIESFEVLGSIQKIGKSAFKGCSKLTKFAATDEIVDIGENAFEDCICLNEIILPESISIISKYAFKNCQQLTSIKLPSSITVIEEGLFSGCSNLRTIEVPESVLNIGENAFKNCRQLTSIKLPSSITVVEEGLFSGCSNLKTIEIPEGVLNIGENAFEDCTCLDEITLPESILTISKYAFKYCRKLTSIKLPSSITVVEEGLFLCCSNLKTIEIPEGVLTIGKNAFEECVSLQQIDFNQNIKRIESGAFNGCSSLSNCAIPKNVTYIGSAIFSGCSQLNNIVIPFVGESADGSGNNKIGHIFETVNGSYVPSTVKQIIITSKIGPNAFEKCDSLIKIIGIDDETVVSLPSSGLVVAIKKGVTELGDFSFKDCTNLTEIVLPESINSIGNKTFSGCSAVQTISIPESILEIKTDAFAGCNLIQYTQYQNGYYFGNSNNQHLVFVGFVEKSKTYTLHEDTKILLANSFKNITDLSTIIIPEGITYIGANNFYSYYSFANVILPSTIVSIGENAFDGGIEYLYYGGTIEDWCNITFANELSNPIGYEGFYMLDTNGTISYKGQKYSKFVDIEIPDTITKIGDYQFADFYDLETVKIPSSVTSIGRNAFSSCLSLREVTIEEGGLLSVGAYAFSFCDKIEAINFPNTVETINFGVFYLCDSIGYLSIPFVGENADGTGETHFGFIFGRERSNYNARWYVSTLEITGNMKSIEDLAFVRCEIGELIISGELEKIESNVFIDCNINSLTLPGSLISVSADAFYTSRYIWGSYAYEEYISIENLYYNGSSEDLFELKYNYRIKLEPFKNIYILDENGEIEYKNNRYSKINDIIIPEGKNEIESKNFSGWDTAKNIYIPVSVKRIYSDAFVGLQSLNNVYYGGTLEDWCEIYFYNNSNPLINAENLYLLDPNGNIKFNGKTFSEVKEIIIPKSITKIGQYQFEGLNYVDKIEIHDNVTQIGIGAFKDVNAGKIRIPFIGERADGKGATHFGFIFGADTVDNNSKYVSRVNEVEIGNGITSVSKSAFLGWDTITTIVLPNSIKNIEIGAFTCKIENTYYNGTLDDWCNMTFAGVTSSPIGSENFYVLNPNSKSDKDKYMSLETLVLDETILVVNDYIFAGHSSLKTLTIKEGITKIGASAFSNCTSLETIEFPNSLVFISSYAFENCSSLKKIELKESLETIDLGAFKGCSSIEEMTLPFLGKSRNTTHGYEGVLGYIFGFNRYIEEDIPSDFESSEYNDITEISETRDNNILQYASFKMYDEIYYYLNTFYYNIPLTLKKVTVTDQNKIPEAALRGCYFIEEVNFNDEINEIGRFAFYKCSSLTNFTAPNTVNSIGFAAFKDCENLENMVLPFVGEKLSRPEHGYLGFIFGTYDVDNQNDFVPEKLKEIIITGGKTIASSAFKGCNNIKTITLPSSLEKIESYAFSGCIGLDAINIPESVKYIGLGAFYNCNFTEITLPFIGESLDGSGSTHFGYIFGAETYVENASYIPSGLKNIVVNYCLCIKEFDFYGYTHLESIEIKKGNVKIERNAFKGFENLQTFEVVDGVGELGEYSFAGCSNIQQLKISGNVKTIGDYAFVKCENLTLICYFSEEYSLNFSPSWNLGVKEVLFDTPSQLLGIQLNVSTKSVLVGDTYYLIVNSIPSAAKLGEMTWISTNPEVATVGDDGLVTGLKKGEANIIVCCGEFVENCLIIVTESQTVTYDFESNFSEYAANWSWYYESHQITADNLGIQDDILDHVELTRASKQDDFMMPTIASKGTEVYITLYSYNVIKEITFNLEQWSSKKLFTTIQIEYMNLSGNWNAIDSSGYSGSVGLTIDEIGDLISAQLPEDSYAVRLKIVSVSSGSNQQVGLESIIVTV